MGGYIGATAVGLTTTAADVQGDITSTDTTPELILKNTSEEDTEGGREGKITFKGEQSGGEETTLAQIESAHDGTSDDEKGDLIFKTNDGSDGASPTERMRIDSDGLVTVSGSLDLGTTTDAATVSTTASDYQLQLGAAQSTTGDIGRNISFDISGTTTAAINSVDGGTSNAQALAFFTGNGSGISEAMRIDSSGNVAIGTTSPATPLDVDGGANSDHATFSGTAGRGLKISTFSVGAADEGVDFDAQASGSTQALSFSTGGTERMRIDGSGTLLVGKTSDTQTDAGHVIFGSGAGYSTRNGFTWLHNRKTTDGEILRFQKDGSTVGNIFSSGGVQMGIGTGDTAILFAANANAWLPWNTDNTQRDNAIDLGRSATRFDDIFATNSSIQTSDEREKQQVASLTSAEITAATAISKLFKTFKWNDSVAENGENARTHTGVIAQQVEQAMTDAGLTASNYAFWCSDTWWETQTEVAAVEADEENGIEAQDAYTRTDTYNTQEEAPEGATERNRKGIRYPELLSFIGAATEQRLTSIEARLDALEGQ